MDRERVARLVGRKVAVGLRISEGQSAEVVATLDEVRDDGVVLSEISDLGSGPKLFCPRDSLKQVGIRPPSLGPVHEEPEPDEEPQEQEYYELYELREAPTEELASEPPQRDQPSARRLNRVVPIGQRRTVGEVVVALTSLEIFDDGLGILRYRVSSEDGTFEGESPCRSSPSRMNPAANCPGRHRTAAAARAKRTARWRCAATLRPGSWRSRQRVWCPWCSTGRRGMR